MATVGSLLFTRLSTFAALASVTGSKVYPVRAKQGATPPYLVYLTAGSPGRESKMAADTKIERPRLQVDVLSKSFDEIELVGQGVKDALNRWETSAGVPQIETTFFLGERDDWDAERGPDDLLRRILEFQLVVRTA